MACLGLFGTLPGSVSGCLWSKSLKAHKNKIRFLDETITDNTLQSLLMMPTLLRSVSHSGVEVATFSGGQRCSNVFEGRTDQQLYGNIELGLSCSQGKGMYRKRVAFPECLRTGWVCLPLPPQVGHGLGEGAVPTSGDRINRQTCTDTESSSWFL